MRRPQRPVAATAAPEVCDGTGRPFQKQTRPVHGCSRCCAVCDLDMHTCPGCGNPVIHGIDICLRCRNTLL